MSDIPEFVERDPAVILQESKAMLEDILGRELQAGQVEQLILQFIAYREVLLCNRFNAGMAQMLYQFSKAPVLDYIANLVAIERLPASRAGCTVRFSLVAGHGSVIIPEGTRVATSDGSIIFATIDDAVVSPEIDSIDLPVLAETPGIAANGYGVGYVSSILDPLAFVSEVVNVDVTGGGSDVESDEQLRERIRLSPSQYTSAGSQGSYRFYAKSASSEITDVSVSSPIPGTVLIVPLTETGNVSQSLLDAIYATCNAEQVRPLTDTVLVSSPVENTYSIEVNVTLFDDADPSASHSAIVDALNAFVESKRKKLGLDIIVSHISQVCRIEQVYDIEVVSPAENMVIDSNGFAVCEDIVVNITGFNHG